MEAIEIFSVYSFNLFKTCIGQNTTKRRIGLSIMIEACEFSQKEAIFLENTTVLATSLAKSMEPPMACRLLQGVIDQGQRVYSLTHKRKSHS